MHEKHIVSKRGDHTAKQDWKTEEQRARQETQYEMAHSKNHKATQNKNTL